MCGSDIFLGLIAFLFPPLPVWIKRGLCSADSLINLALCCLGVLPGLIHAWYIIAKYPDPTYEEVPQDAEDGRVTYYYIQQDGTRQPQAGNQRSQRGYGTVGSAPSQQFPGQESGTAPPAQYLPRPERMQNGGSSAEAPPSYQDSVRGDNKVQQHD